MIEKKMMIKEELLKKKMIKKEVIKKEMIEKEMIVEEEMIEEEMTDYRGKHDRERDDRERDDEIRFRRHLEAANTEEEYNGQNDTHKLNSRERILIHRYLQEGADLMATPPEDLIATPGALLSTQIDHIMTAQLDLIMTTQIDTIMTIQVDPIMTIQVDPIMTIQMIEEGYRSSAESDDSSDSLWRYEVDADFLNGRYTSIRTMPRHPKGVRLNFNNGACNNQVALLPIRDENGVLFQGRPRKSNLGFPKLGNASCSTKILRDTQRQNGLGHQVIHATEGHMAHEKEKVKEQRSSSCLYPLLSTHITSSLWFTEVQEHLDLWSANWDLVTEYGYANKAKLGPIRGELSKGSLTDLASCFVNMITLRALADRSQAFHLTIPLRSGFEFCVQQSDPQGQKAP
ncbi:hypothetical protein ACRRTK_001984 [Alexandromys fortis]